MERFPKKNKTKKAKTNRNGRSRFVVVVVAVVVVVVESRNHYVNESIATFTRPERNEENVANLLSQESSR